MGVVLVSYVRMHSHAHMCMHTLYRARCMTFAKYKRYQGLRTVEPESQVKLLVRIRERTEIIYITIVFVSVFIGFIIAASSWLTLPGHFPGSGHFPFEQPKQLIHGHLPLARDTTVMISLQGAPCILIFQSNGVSIKKNCRAPHLSYSYMYMYITSLLLIQLAYFFFDLHSQLQ